MSGRLSDPLEITVGDDYRLEVTVVDDAGDPVNCSTWTVESQIREDYDDATAAATFTVDDTDAATGVFVLTLTDTQTATLPVKRLLVDFQRTASGLVSTIFRGYVIVRQAVTQ